MNVTQILRDIVAALSLLTRLPVRPNDAAVGANAAWAYPLVGVFAGLVAVATGYLALQAGLPPFAAGIVAIASQVLLTGALHEDGLADCSDALGARGTAEARLAIMRDSQIGTYGTLALVLSVVIRASLMGTLLQSSLFMAPIFAAMLSRATMPAIMALLPLARKDGLSRLTGRPPFQTLAIAIGIAVLPVALWMGFWAILPISAAAFGAVIPAHWANRRIGGQTGDVLGAAQQCAEMAVLMALISVAAWQGAIVF